MTRSQAVRFSQVGLLVVAALALQVRADDCDGSNGSDPDYCPKPGDGFGVEPGFCSSQNFTEKNCGLMYEWSPEKLVRDCYGTPTSNPKRTRCFAVGTATPAGWVPSFVTCGYKWQCKIGEKSGVCTAQESVATEVLHLEFKTVACAPNPAPPGGGQ